MKKLIGLLLFTIVFSAFSQKNNDMIKTYIDHIIESKPIDYFSLHNYLNKQDLTIYEAQSLFDKSLNTKYIIGQIFALNSMGRAYRNQSEYSKALEYHQRALKLAEITGNVDVQILTLNLIGVIYRRQDDIRNALDYHQSALSLAKKIKKPNLENKKSISVSQNSIGNIYLTLHQYELALDQFNTCIKVQEELNNKRGLAINYQNIGKAQEELGLINEALISYTKSLSYNLEINSKLGKVICYNSICGALIKKGDYKAAYDTIQKIYPISLTLNDKYYGTNTLSNLGLAELKNNKLDLAKEHLKKALVVSENYHFIQNQINTSFYLSELYQKLDSLKVAFQYYKKANNLEKKTVGEKNILYVNNLISKHNIQSKVNEINALESKTKIQTLQLARNRNILIITLISLALISVALYSVYIQRMLKNDQKILLLEQQALQTQMNPHFIFNALNSIKLYIINNEQKNAVYYLNKFSKLIRNILDVSKIKEVSLKDELNTMDLYMSIENIRFNNEITYTVQINDNVNTDTIKVPPLILQPFIENAIWHGLSSKKGEKKITLSVSKISPSQLEIIIKDNGVGRELATEIKKGKSLKRKSIGIDLTKERLNTFAHDYSAECSIVYTDLKDDQGNPTGTKVSLIFPLN
ncbi:tetratricopeptide repeat protein [Tenacibaculum sp. IB213877]|uniref:tetratricopeptide repeat-containing sensor histidine kinase n=1 Tax=Tenacibaculum sp. IB213877 TaxID=3097351 RepID=UPI002A5A74CF|nr:tetratricopeptide repeat protein [Tenacibaculum sp. IB213877]MDY0780350.1 tetratricopeptide repeat protein [Tenacibaculum sp. IB213877]